MAIAILRDKTYLPKAGTIQRRWFLLDGKDQVLGRLCTRIAKILMGKNKAIYTHSVDCGDFVIVVNVEKIRLTGKKIDQKVSFHHTAHPGGARIIPYRKMMEEKPQQALYLAVRRMLPKNRLASRQILRMKIYRGESHPHAVQNPVKLNGTE